MVEKGLRPLCFLFDKFLYWVGSTGLYSMKILNGLALGILSVLLFRLLVGEGSVAHIVDLQKKIAQQEQVNQRLSARNQVLADEIIGLQNGFETIEAYARSELGMVKPNETFFLIVPEKQ